MSGLDPVTQDRLDRSVLDSEDPCRTREFRIDSSTPAV